MNRSAEQVGKVHLETAEREEARRMHRIGLDEEVDVAIGPEPIGENRPEQVQANDSRGATEVGDAAVVDFDTLDAHIDG